MSIFAAYDRWRERRRDEARREAEAKARAQGKLNDEVIADGEQAERDPGAPGDLGVWER
jgi:hypothetical protein